MLKEVGLVLQKLALPHIMSGFHPAFHISMLNKYNRYGDYIIYWDPKLFGKELSYEKESISILAKDVRKLRRWVIFYVKF